MERKQKLMSTLFAASTALSACKPTEERQTPTQTPQRTAVPTWTLPFESTETPTSTSTPVPSETPSPFPTLTPPPTETQTLEPSPIPTITQTPTPEHQPYSLPETQNNPNLSIGPVSLEKFWILKIPEETSQGLGNLTFGLNPIAVVTSDFDPEQNQQFERYEENPAYVLNTNVPFHPIVYGHSYSTQTKILPFEAFRRGELSDFVGKNIYIKQDNNTVTIQIVDAHTVTAEEFWYATQVPRSGSPLFFDLGRLNVPQEFQIPDLVTFTACKELQEDQDTGNWFENLLGNLSPEQFARFANRMVITGRIVEVSSN